MESQVADKFDTRRSEVIMDVLEKWNDSFSGIFSSGFDGFSLGMKMLSDLLVGDLLSQNKGDKVEKFGLDFLGIFFSGAYHSSNHIWKVSLRGFLGHLGVGHNLEGCDEVTQGGFETIFDKLIGGIHKVTSIDVQIGDFSDDLFFSYSVLHSAYLDRVSALNVSSWGRLDVTYEVMGRLIRVVWNVVDFVLEKNE